MKPGRCPQQRDPTLALALFPSLAHHMIPKEARTQTSQPLPRELRVAFCQLTAFFFPVLFPSSSYKMHKIENLQGNHFSRSPTPAVPRPWL